MNYNIFEEKYNRAISINQHYKILIFEFLRRLEKDYSIELDCDFKKHFIYYKNLEKITYEEISSRLSEKEITVSVDTLKSYSRKDRCSYTSKYSKEIAGVLNVSEDMLLYGKDRIIIMSMNSLDIKELFCRLGEQNQKAIIYLLDALYMEKIVPELFEDMEW